MSQHGSSHFSPEEKIQAVLRVLHGETHTSVGNSLNVSTDRIARWEARFMEGGARALEHRRRKNGTKRRLAVIGTWVAVMALAVGVTLVVIRFIS